MRSFVTQVNTQLRKLIRNYASKYGIKYDFTLNCHRQISQISEDEIGDRLCDVTSDSVSEKEFATVRTSGLEITNKKKVELSNTFIINKKAKVKEHLEFLSNIFNINNKWQ